MTGALRGVAGCPRFTSAKPMAKVQTSIVHKDFAQNSPTMEVEQSNVSARQSDDEPANDEMVAAAPRAPIGIKWGSSIALVLFWFSCSLKLVKPCTERSEASPIVRNMKGGNF